ncbi:uncharacterized protein LOC117574916 isoform X2 [Drosophila albomicans]|uniref:Uncharacterized protein LOC117574916 isoform X2 n=1 Tax=Drosophila albomicans TaxID=7291 RepID=A0A9C6SVN1_DROAB|nr:uncharacterized protein LOC117574916 isoform X2 [Drosophila albomicans]
MIRQLLLQLLTLAMEIASIYGSCSVTRIIMRVPRDRDVGLIFDLTVSNPKAQKSEMLGFTVTSDDICTLNTSRGEQLLAGSIFGGDFGYIEPGSSITVSLMWPTVSLYNRVGSCPILVSSVNHKKEVNRTNQILHFDTRFETLDPGNHSLRRRKDFTDCKNWDQNYFRNCTPLNCEELYFGKRSFYNRTSEQCEAVPACIRDGIQYDFYANECVDVNNFITEDEIDQLKQGKFDNNYMELQEYEASRANKQMQEQKNTNTAPNRRKENIKQQPHEIAKECNFETKLSLIDFNNCFQHLNSPKTSEYIKVDDYRTTGKKVSKKSTMTSILKNFYYDWYSPLNAEHDDDNENENDLENIGANSTNSKAAEPYWAKMSDLGPIGWLSLIMEMLLIILATVFTYTVVCFTLYCVMELIAMMKPYEVTSVHIGKKLTPRKKREELEVMTSASLMSQTR